jgi:hypothetical protein
MNKAQHTTRGIKHWGLSGYSSIQPRIKFGVSGQESSPQSPTISYRQRWHACETTALQLKNRLIKK